MTGYGSFIHYRLLLDQQLNIADDKAQKRMTQNKQQNYPNIFKEWVEKM